jgi:hypothetical protein
MSLGAPTRSTSALVHRQWDALAVSARARPGVDAKRSKTSAPPALRQLYGAASGDDAVYAALIARRPPSVLRVVRAAQFNRELALARAAQRLAHRSADARLAALRFKTFRFAAGAVAAPLLAAAALVVYVFTDALVAAGPFDNMR